MLVQIIADHPNRISDLRALLGSEYRVSSALLNDEIIVAVEYYAAITAADLRIADNIAALKAISLKYKNAPRRIFVIDQAPMTRGQAYEILCGMRGNLEAPLVTAFKETALANVRDWVNVTFGSSLRKRVSLLRPVYPR